MADMRTSVLVNINVKKEELDADREPTLADFKMIIVLGKGTFGKVFLAEFQFNKQLYAIKVIRKDILIEYN
jgi:serine/threonine protein kinase